VGKQLVGSQLICKNIHLVEVDDEILGDFINFNGDGPLPRLIALRTFSFFGV
jgi:hypothetical protein